ncbi:MAG: DNA cytosine methyltransferase [Gomphosphaeria aponina SAG 52.96 = DSM 107014]|uniref:Cytosine-specific methyltransferase n=1 Tax=Gomphosphaeria aponina SAG 52.96 = DSM 107014 TaxID=1521640 RepID=A0A941GTL5_9CHRO|nr:DNA cytosine methyltransferase [Gomphosphaeria aponina SAG 52.96 = DSM 107014]
MKERPIAIDLFAGCGGMSLGLEAAGFDVAVAVEFDAVHALVHHFNFPYCNTICKDISQVKSTEIIDSLKLKGYSTEVDLIAGGPPCQGFSHIGKRQIDDPRNALVFEYLRLVSEIRPKYFLFENVPGIGTGKHQQFLEELMIKFASIGYRIQKPIKIIDASEYGAPQKRKRLIIIGSREDVTWAKYPEINCDNVDKFTTVSEAISDLEKIEAFTNTDKGIAIANLEYVGKRKKYCIKPSDIFALCHLRQVNPIVYGHIGSVHTQTSIERFANTEPGTVEPKSRFFKLAANGLCNTLRAGTNSDKGAYTAPRPIHYSLPRCITVREAARLHVFPDWFQFHRTIWHGFRQIGNAVIPLLSKKLGSSVIDALGEKTTKFKCLTLEKMPEELLSYNRSQASAYWGIADNVIPKRKPLV